MIKKPAGGREWSRDRTRSRTRLRSCPPSPGPPARNGAISGILFVKRGGFGDTTRETVRFQDTVRGSVRFHGRDSGLVLHRLGPLRAAWRSFLPLYISFCLSVALSLFSLCLPVSRSLCLYFSLSVSLSFCLSVSLPICLTVSL